MSNFSVVSCDPNTASAGDGELDFNMLSEYLFNEEDRLPSWPGMGEDFVQGEALSDREDLSSGEEDDEDGPPKKSAKGKSQDQLDRRRERNRVLARKTRLRKKFFFESLQQQVSQLATENELLKNVIRQRLTGHTRDQILSNCKSFELPPLIANNAVMATQMLEKADYGLVKAIQTAQRSFVITDPSLPDNPIIFASQGFLDLCGYPLDQVLGRNCRFLQGPDTDPSQVEILHNGIAAGVDTSVCLLNYRADGSTFYNQIFVAALRDADHKIINFVGVQVEVKPLDKKTDNDARTVSSTITESTSLAPAPAANSNHSGAGSGAGRPKRARK